MFVLLSFALLIAFIIVGFLSFILFVFSIEENSNENFYAALILGIISCIPLVGFIFEQINHYPGNEDNHQTTQGVVEKIEPFNNQLIFHFEDQRVMTFRPQNGVDLTVGQPYEITYNPKLRNQIIEIKPISMSEMTTPFIRLNENPPQTTKD